MTEVGGSPVMTDDEHIEQFTNMLSWPMQWVETLPDGLALRWPVPPAVHAYRIGLTLWCPPRGTM